MWFILAISSAIIYSFRGLLEKRLVGRLDPMALGFGLRLFALPFFVLPFVFKPELFIPLNQLPLRFWIVALTVSSICGPIETYFYYRAIREEELSLALPILSLAPVLTIILGIVLLHELPSAVGVIGMLCILFGIYMLKVGHAKHGLMEPLLHLARNPSVRMMAIVAVSLAAGSIFDKVGVTSSNAYMYAVVNYAFLCVALVIMARFTNPQSLRTIPRHAGGFAVLGGVVAAYTLLYLVALSMGNTAYTAGIRSTSTLFSIVWGLVLLKERDAAAKLLAGALLLLGLVLIKVYG